MAEMPLFIVRDDRVPIKPGSHLQADSDRLGVFERDFEAIFWNGEDPNRRSPGRDGRIPLPIEPAWISRTPGVIAAKDYGRPVSLDVRLVGPSLYRTQKWRAGQANDQRGADVERSKRVSPEDVA